MSEQGILKAIVILTALAVVGEVAILVTGGTLEAGAGVFAFTAPTVAGLLALFKAAQTKTQVDQQSKTVQQTADKVEQLPQQISDKVDEVMSDKSVIATNDLPPSLGGDDNTGGSVG